ncbi:hypothetical protein PRIPAC_73296 [Pristionchus pacificus]|nr:hypothetical protein PRIPAC_73296 [Pristionchus pacificus]
MQRSGRHIILVYYALYSCKTEGCHVRDIKKKDNGSFRRHRLSACYRGGAPLYLAQVVPDERMELPRDDSDFHSEFSFCSDTSPLRSATMRSPPPAPKTEDEASPLRTTQRIVLSLMHTAIRVNTTRSNDKSQKESKKSNRSGKREAAKARLMASDYRTSTNLNTAINLFGPTAHTGRDSALSPALGRPPSLFLSQRDPLRPQSNAVSPEKSEKEREQSK